jgi:hypothetical protein
LSGGEVIKVLNRAGLSARLIEGRILISPAYAITGEIRDLVKAHRTALMAALQNFGGLNEVPPDARGIPFDRWLRSLPPSAFREDNR